MVIGSALLSFDVPICAMEIEHDPCETDKGIAAYLSNLERPLISSGGVQMKFIAAVVLSSFAVSAIAADTYVRPHVRRDGTYVERHWRSSPNSTRFDNYSTQGNVNPYTGARGTTDPLRIEQPTIQPIQPMTPLEPLRPYR
jgi:hypothetical protein